ncbi:hypothetical protein ACRAWF_12610, partial [Streptomyces sp. L7]
MSSTARRITALSLPVRHPERGGPHERLVQAHLAQQGPQVDAAFVGDGDEIAQDVRLDRRRCAAAGPVRVRRGEVENTALTSSSWATTAGALTGSPMSRRRRRRR